MNKNKHCMLVGSGSNVKLSYLFLLMACGIEFLYATTYFICIDGFFMINEYFANTYLIIPCLLFAGAAVTHPLSVPGKHRLLLGFATACWFMIVQVWHAANDWGYNALGPFFFLFLLAFPFATVTRDGKRNIGLYLLGQVYIAAALMLIGYTLLLYMGYLPEMMRDYIFWGGARLTNIWSPNPTACLLMIGFGFSIAFFCSTAKRWLKGVLLLIAAASFACMTLTNSRTTILTACAMMGGICFFALIHKKGGWKRCLIAGVAAIVITGGLFLFSKGLYQIHTDIRISQITEQLEAEKAEADVQEIPAETGKTAQTPTEEIPASAEPQAVEVVRNEDVFVGTLYVDPNTGETTLQSNAGQGSLIDDIWTLNGRTTIWKAAFRALLAEPKILFLGTKNVTNVVASYGSFPAAHAHNSWIQTVMNLGLLGLIFALVYSWIVLRSAFFLLFDSRVELWKKAIVILVLGLLVTGMLEAYLFASDGYHFIAFPFHLCGGYLAHWRDQLLEKE